MNLDRRKFLKFLLVVSGVFVVERLFGRGLSYFNNAFFGVKPNGFGTGKNFRIVETENQVIFLNQEGEKILIIDKEDILET